MGRMIRPQNLNDVFQQGANYMRQKPVELSHRHKVMRLYRHSLRCLLDWCIDRDIFHDESTKLRERFDANRVTSMANAQRLIDDAEDELFKYTHPDKYKIPYMPGGTKFMRNAPPPIEVCFPDGNYPDDAPLYTVNPDYSIAKPENGRNATGTVLVDFYKKTME